MSLIEWQPHDASSAKFYSPDAILRSVSCAPANALLALSYHGLPLTIIALILAFFASMPGSGLVRCANSNIALDPSDCELVHSTPPVL